MDVDEVRYPRLRQNWYKNGRFAAKAWGTVVLRVWKTGYAMRDIQVGSAGDLVGHEISIELRKLQSSNSVPVAINREGMRINDGFSFRSGKVVAPIVRKQTSKYQQAMQELSDSSKLLETAGFVFRHFPPEATFIILRKLRRNVIPRRLRSYPLPWGFSMRVHVMGSATPKFA